VALVAGSLFLGKRHSAAGGNRASATLAALESNLLLIEGRVEGIRRLDFTRRPLPTLVSGSEVKRQGLLELDQQVTVPQQSAEDELLKLLGLIPSDSNLRAIQSAVFQDQVAGFYDPNTKRLALVKDAGAQNAGVGEITLAHELTHALDDQRFGLKDQPPGMNDSSSAYNALVEGDATSVMTRYATRYMTESNLLGALFASATAGGPSLPPYIQSSLEFPYLEGQRFVDTLYRYGHNSWKLVNAAFKSRPPLSTQQILHPLDYIRNVKPLPIQLRVRPLLGRQWRRVTGGSLGEFDTSELIQLGIGTNRAGNVAADWRGGVYELWRSGRLPSPGCASPCRRRDSLVLAWRTAPGAGAQDFAAAVGAYVVRGLSGQARGRNVWTLPGSSAASLTTNGGTTVLAMAPTATMAAVLSQRAATAPLGR
jgi:hypothetical protein